MVTNESSDEHARTDAETSAHGRAALDRLVGGVYAPPREDGALPAAAPPKPPPPFRVRALTHLFVWVANGALAYGLMALVPVLDGPLGAGTLAMGMATLSWIALTAFAIMTSLSLGAGLFGPQARVSGREKAIVAVAGVVATAVCFVPLPPWKGHFLVRGVLGLVSEGLTLAITLRALTIVQRRHAWTRDKPFRDSP